MFTDISLTISIFHILSRPIRISNKEGNDQIFTEHIIEFAFHNSTEKPEFHFQQFCYFSFSLYLRFEILLKLQVLRKLDHKRIISLTPNTISDNNINITIKSCTFYQLQVSKL